MSTDIHCFLEVKYDDRWSFLAKVDIGADYELFDMLAGLEGGHLQRHVLRGLPYISETVKIFHTYYMPWRDRGKETVDCHHKSWMFRVEFMRILKDWGAARLFGMDGMYNGIIETLGIDDGRDCFEHIHRIPKPDESRVVFWFDN